MALSDLMRELAARMGLGEIELEDDGGAQLVIDGNLEVDLIADVEGTGFAAVATVGPFRETDREAAMAELLEVNLFGQATGGACLALDTNRGEIVLRCHFPETDIAFDVFDTEMAGFVGALRYWRGRNSAGLIGTGAEAEDGGLDSGEDAPLMRV